MAGIDKRVEDLERRFGGGQPVRLNVVREGQEKPDYSVIITPDGKFIREAKPAGEGRTDE